MDDRPLFLTAEEAAEDYGLTSDQIKSLHIAGEYTQASRLSGGQTSVETIPLYRTEDVLSNVEQRAHRVR